MIRTCSDPARSCTEEEQLAPVTYQDGNVCNGEPAKWAVMLVDSVMYVPQLNSRS
jgi:hypothetical protein